MIDDHMEISDYLFLLSFIYNILFNYNRYFEKYQEWGMDKEKSIEYAEKDVKKEITDAIQTLNYQLNSLTTTNG